VRKNVSRGEQISSFQRYKIVFSNHEARLDIFSSMMVSLAFFAYLTAIPFVYLTVFKVSEFSFSILFGITVLALMCSHLINTRLVTRKGSRKMLWYGLVLSLLSSVALLFANIYSLSLIFTVLLILPLMGSVAMVAVNSDALVLTKFPEQSGTATAVLGIFRFGVGALAGPILAYFYDGSALPFAVLMCFAMLMVFLCQLMIKLTEK
jgi:DHA1 family bicyclomycin/chloramphenicol resistance-like MFS transporter